VVVRRQEPQPAIPKEFLPEAAQMKNIHLLGSPSYVQIENQTFLLYHATSIHNIIDKFPELSNSNPQDAMEEYIRRRELALTYGDKNPIMPEHEDYMAIKYDPDVFAGGHVHHNGYKKYRMTTIINSGTWQKLTEFQLKMGHTPTPGIPVIYDLKDFKIKEKVFYKGN
jgi:DNA polymerase II small subunit